MIVLYVVDIWIKIQSMCAFPVLLLSLLILILSADFWRQWFYPFPPVTRQPKSKDPKDHVLKHNESAESLDYIQPAANAVIASKLWTWLPKHDRNWLHLEIPLNKVFIAVHCSFRVVISKSWWCRRIMNCILWESLVLLRATELIHFRLPTFHLLRSTDRCMSAEQKLQTRFKCYDAGCLRFSTKTSLIRWCLF